MEYLFHIGAGLFIAGLIGTHIVTFATRNPKRKGKPIKPSLRILMWASPALALVGLVLAAIWYFTR